MQRAARLGADRSPVAHDRRLRRLEGDVLVRRPCRRALRAALDLRGCARWPAARPAPCGPRAAAGARSSRSRVARSSVFRSPVSSSIFSWLARSWRLILASVSCWIALDQALALVLVHVDDHVLGEVQDLLERARGHVQQQADAARRALDEPDVADRRGQLDVAHALAAHLGARDLDAALVADDALVADALVLAAGAFPVLLRTEDALAEQAVALGLERAVVDRLGLGDLAARPRPDLLRRGEGDPNRVEIVDFEHLSRFPLARTR